MASTATTILLLFLFFFMAVSWDPNQANEDKSQLRGQTHKKMTETNSRYYGNVDTFLPPSATFHLFFSLAIADTYEYFVKNPDSHNIKNEATLQ